MKRYAVSAAMLVLLSFALAAAVWDGSAVAGVAGDFPDDGLYGACNSFPRDTSVTVTNLENGKTVTVTVTKGVDNPGVFIALSPKAAASLGMSAGSAARIRAVAMTASQAETALAPARAGETADPDFNPKVYVEREKAAVAAAAAAAPAAAAPAAAAQPAASASAAATTGAAAQPAVVPAAVPAAAAPETAEVLAKVGEPKKAAAPALPSLTEPKPSSPPAQPAAALPVASIAAAPAPEPKPPVQTPAATAAAPQAIPADVLPLPPAAFSFPGSPKPAPLGMSLPSPDLPTIPATTSPTPRGGYLAQAPEILGGGLPQPRKPAVPRVAIVEPSAPESAQALAKRAEKASVEALQRPAPASAKPAFALLDPSLAPDVLPESIMSRIIAPTKVAPVPVLAEVENSKEAEKGLEAIALEKPSYAEQVEAAALAEASVVQPSEAYVALRPGRAGSAGAVAELAEAELPGAPEAIAGRLGSARTGALAELQAPDAPRPSEGIAAERPTGPAAGQSLAGLDEPLPIAPSATGSGPTAIADSRPGPGQTPLGELGEPLVPSPDSLVAGKPRAVAPGQAIAELAEPSPTSSTAPAAVAATTPEQPTAVATVPETATALAAERPAAVVAPPADLESPAVPSPTESIASQQPAPAAGELMVALEPAEPRPPQATATAVPEGVAALTPAQPKAPPTAPAVVATVKGASPAGAAQPPASIPMLSSLTKGSYYVQIGVYGTNDALQSAIGGFRPTYPLAVERLTTKAGSLAYRLFVGPLSRDESGLVLIKIRSLGFKDAYLRQGS